MNIMKILLWSLLIFIFFAMMVFSCLLIRKYSLQNWERDVVSPDNLEKVNQFVKTQTRIYEKGHNDESRLAIVTLDDRPNMKYVVDQRKIVKKYCDKYGYTQISTDNVENIYESYKAPKDSIYIVEDYPIYWQKIAAIWAVLNTNEFDYVMWLDSDAAMTHDCGPLADIFDMTPTKHLFVVAEVWHKHALNAGFFAIKNSSKGREILEDWLDSYFKSAKHKWSKRSNEKNKWDCECCIYGGDEYEQGQLNKIARKHNQFTLQYHPSQMNYMGWDNFMLMSPKDVDVLIQHFYGISELERNAKMRRILEAYPSFKRQVDTIDI